MLQRACCIQGRTEKVDMRVRFAPRDQEGKTLPGATVRSCKIVKDLPHARERISKRDWILHDIQGYDCTSNVSILLTRISCYDNSDSSNFEIKGSKIFEAFHVRIREMYDSLSTVNLVYVHGYFCNSILFLLLFVSL